MKATRRLCALVLLLIACGAASKNAYKIYRPNSSGSANGVRIIVRRVAVSHREIVITMTLQNLAPGFATFLPYNKSVLTDDRDDVYRSIETRDWRLTDKQLFLGVRLAGNAQYTGTMRFLAPSGAASTNGSPHALHLEIAPVVREDAQAQPFSVELPVIALRE
ncbi:MAG: hypothetical protein M3126_05605 [Candidatus Eremiobacteraeota bacterium]|nr:hypothetical protein [Candidatus Eremiobacteraeota bacterium]